MALAADRARQAELATPAKRKRDWVPIATLLAATLPGIAAVVALVLTVQSIQQGEQGQITDRYNAAITNLGSTSIEVRLGGVYALQRIMQDSPRDQHTIIAVLCAFVRNQALARPTKKLPRRAGPIDLLAALHVVGTRQTPKHGPAIGCDLTAAVMQYANLRGADLARTNLTGADLHGSDLSGADLEGANLKNANLIGTWLSGANLTHANLYQTEFEFAHLNGADLLDATVHFVITGGADLTGAEWPKGHHAPYGWIFDGQSRILKKAPPRSTRQ